MWSNGHIHTYMPSWAIFVIRNSQITMQICLEEVAFFRPNCFPGNCFFLMTLRNQERKKNPGAEEWMPPSLYCCQKKIQHDQTIKNQNPIGLQAKTRTQPEVSKIEMEVGLDTKHKMQGLGQNCSCLEAPLIFDLLYSLLDTKTQNSTGENAKLKKMKTQNSRSENAKLKRSPVRLFYYCLISNLFLKLICVRPILGL